MIEVSPEVPSSILGLGPVPEIPGGDRSLVHVGRIVSIVEFGPFGVASEVALAQLVSSIVVNQVIALDGDGHLDNSSGPAVVVAAIDHSEGGVLDCHIVEGSLQGFGGGDADEGELVIAGLISLEGVAVIAREPARPVALVGGPGGGLEGEALLHGLETELVDVGDASVADRCRPACQEQQHCNLHAFHKLYILLQPRKNYCGLIITLALRKNLSQLIGKRILSASDEDAGQWKQSTAIGNASSDSIQHIHANS